MAQNKPLHDFIKARPHLVWYVSDLEQLSESSIVEHTLNYGTWQDVRELIAILGMSEAARIFAAQQEGERTNYRPEIANYFQLYFSHHAAH